MPMSFVLSVRWTIRRYVLEWHIYCLLNSLGGFGYLMITVYLLEYKALLTLPN